FVYETGGGDVVITDFSPAEGDKIDLTGLSAVDDLSGLLADAIQVGGDTVIDFGNGDKLTLQNTSASQLAADGFLFAVQVVSSGAVSSGVALAGGGEQDVYGVASNTELENGAVQIVESGGTGIGAVVNSGGLQIVAASGVAIGSFINSSGSEA